MVRLIVEEDGGRKAFRLGQGVLTVGSGPEARLKLASSEVAELHAEIELRGDTILLRPRPGVAPPTVEGATADGEVVLALGETVRIGGARLWLEDEAVPTTPPSLPAEAADAADFGDAHAARRRRAMEEATEADPRTVVRRTKPRIKRGMNPAAQACIGIGIIIILLFVGIKLFTGGEESVYHTGNTLAGIQRHINDGQIELADNRLDQLEKTSLSRAEQNEVSALRDQIRKWRKEQEKYQENEVGTRYLGNQLQKYEKQYLQGNPDLAKIRLFLLRCQTFRKRWPNHEEMSWVDRHERRFGSIVSLADPPTLDDILWQVKDCVNTAPRYYRDAFALLDEFAATANAEDRVAVDQKRTELIAERKEYAVDRLQQAKYEFEKKENPGKAVWWLVNSVCHLGDPEMENEAARTLLKMPDLEGHLLGYKDKRPEYWPLLMRNDLVQARAKKLGIE